MVKLEIPFIVAASLVLCAIAIPTHAELGVDTIATDSGELIIHPISHATFVMKTRSTTIYVDPVGGGGLFSDFPPPDLILITHIHGDHTSAETAAAVSTGSTLVVAPATVAEKLGSSVPGELKILANGESLDHAGVRVEAIPAYNLTEERLGFHPEGRDNGYVVTVDGKRIYIAGDTEDIPEMRALENIDAAFICMNLPYTMTVERAADAVLEFAPGIVYPYHYRGKGGMSDLETFGELVAANPEIEVRHLTWY
jgi:L-ascorbate metabolism protein UlaG (beta-lactamase superfamily)